MFLEFKAAIQRQFLSMKGLTLFRVQIDKDNIWNTYLSAFPEGTNPQYKEKTEHDCSSCRNFVKNIGDIVAIAPDNRLVSIWDIQIEGFYKVVADRLSEYVKSQPIENIYLHFEGSVGVDKNRQMLEDKRVVSWDHLHVQLPPTLHMKGDKIGEALGKATAAHDVLLRGLKELTVDSMQTVLELIAQNSLYRGEERRSDVQKFLELKNKFDKLTTDEERDRFAWFTSRNTAPAVTMIRNTTTGTLLIDLSEGKDLEHAVRAFEAVMAPANYKRPTALVTQGMISKAKVKVEELGLTSALTRRFATLPDITINNVLYADRNVRGIVGGVFDQLAAATPVATKSFDRVDEVPIDKFIQDILPTAETIEVLFENKHAGNLVSLIAPVDLTAKTMFKWANGFSWSYKDDNADSIRERVKAAGGKVEGELRTSLSWFNSDDLDLHMYEPTGDHIHFGIKESRSTGGNLDVDMNAGGRMSRTPVENIIYPDKRRLKEGVYTVAVHQYYIREAGVDVGFEVELEFGGNTFNFAHPKAVAHKQYVTVAKLMYTHKDGFKVIESLPSAQASRTEWGMTTQTFHKVSVVMQSPNYWDDNHVGNRHYFFMLEGAINDGTARPFFNEFLHTDLREHERVLELVGARMKTEKSEDQLSGLGFSSTRPASLTAKVTGKFTRTIKIVF